MHKTKDVKNTMKLAWIDLETTGLDPRLCEILEVYCRITDIHLQTDVEYYALVDNGCSVDAIFEAVLDPEVRAMHQESGLYRALKEAEAAAELRPLSGVEFDLAKLFEEYNGGDRESLYLIGNTVAFDRSFLAQHCPTVLNNCHYRIADISSTRIQMAAITGEDWEFAKRKAHRAGADIQESIEEFRFLWGEIARWFAKKEDVDIWSVKD